MKALINVRIYDYFNYIPNGFVIYDERVRLVGDMVNFEFVGQQFDGGDLVDQADVLDCGGKLLLPGLINFHTHVYSALVRGFDFKRSPQTFSELLEGVWWRFDHFLTLDDLKLCAHAYAMESLKKGVVGIIDHHASGVIPGSTAVIEKGLKDVGLHGLTCFETSDRFDVHAAIAENLEMMKRTNGPFGLHASMSLSDHTLYLIKQQIDKHPIHVHLAESLEDQTKYHDTPTVRLLKQGLLNPYSLLAHCVHITEKDAHIIKSQEAVVALNPRSNLNNLVGSFNFDLLNKKEIPLVVGTDGLGTDVARSWQDFFYWAKASTGKMDGMLLAQLRGYLKESYHIYAHISGRRLGSFEPSYEFDAILVDYHPFTPMTQENAFSHVFYGVFDQMSVENVWIGGDLKLKNRQPSFTPDYGPDYQNDVVARLWQRIEENHGYKG